MAVASATSPTRRRGRRSPGRLDAARATFEALPYSHEQRHVLAIADTKTLALLREGRR